MSPPTNGIRRRSSAAPLLLAAALVWAGCSEDPGTAGPDTGGDPSDVTAATDSTADTGGASSSGGADTTTNDVITDAGAGGDTAETPDSGASSGGADGGGSDVATGKDGGSSDGAANDDAGGADSGAGKDAGCDGKETKEECNGIDDDCDGETDEGTCDDGNSCTIKKCIAEFGVCDTEFLKDGAECDNGQKCNGPDYCQGSVCLPGPATNCNDGNPCTTDSCDNDKNQCANVPVADATPCDDNSACTLGDACGAGLCLPGAVTTCNDLNDCTVDACDPKKGCSNTFDDGKGCNDGNACTENDACKDGKCLAGADKACAAGKPCETVTCASDTGACGLVPKKDADPCTDSEQCAVDKTCDKGECKGGKTKDCDDGNPCTKDTCVEASGGNCLHIKAPNAAACDDGDACTTDDECQNNVCVSKQKDCGDSNPCTSDTCEKATGCAYANNKNLCNDGDNCTLADQCADGKCAAGKKKDCDDNEGCTVDTCDPKSGICDNNAAPLAGKPCAGDDDECTAGDKCVLGKCQIGDAKKCVDSDPCTLDQCDPKTAKCTFLPQKAGGSCNDDSFCTFKDKCDDKGKCVGTALPCDDGNGCTADGCNATTGECAFKQLSANELCDDGDKCTLGDKCNAQLQCEAGAKKNCDDGNKCSNDGCDSKTGQCTYTNAPGDCDDGTICTLSEHCVGAKCGAGDDGRTTTYAGSGQYGYSDGNAASAQFRNPRDVAVGKNGEMFIVDTSNYRIRRVDASGKVTTLAGNGLSNHIDGKGSNASFGTVYGIALSAASTEIYVADWSYHTIRKIKLDGTVTTFAGFAKSGGFLDGSGTGARFNRPYNIVAMPDDSLFVTDEYNHRIRKISPTGSVTSFAGSSSAGNTDGKGGSARFNRPHGITADHKSNLYVCDYNNHRIRRISTVGQVTTIAGSSAGFANGQATSARFYYPEDIAYSPGGYLVIVDRQNQRIRRLTLLGTVSSIAGTGSAGYTDGLPNVARFNYPYGLGIDTYGLMYVADTSNHRVRRVAVAKLLCDDFSPCTTDSCHPTSGCQHNNVSVGGKCTDGTKCETDGLCDAAGQCKGKPKSCADSNPCTIDSCDAATGACVYGFSSDNCNDGDLCTEGELCTVGSCMVTTAKVSTYTGSGQWGANNGKGTAASHYYPRGMDDDGKGNVYVADASGYRIRKIDAQQNVTTIAGSGSNGWTDGAAATARFGFPTDVAVATNGDIYVADRNNHRIRRISGGNVSTWAGNGSGTFKDGKGTAASFYYPEGIDVDANNNVYVADSYNHRIRKIDSSQNVTVVIGKSQGYSEGSINDALFYRPTDVAVGAAGELFVADAYNHRIRRIKDGKSSLYAGSAYGHADGKGPTALFRYPSNLDYYKGKLYVADRSNNRIRVVEAGGATWTLAGQESAGYAEGDAGSKARFSNPYGVLATDFGVLVGDSSNHRVRVITSVAKNCDDGDPCSADSCDDKTGKCVNAPIKGCCIPTLFHGAFESAAEAEDLTFEDCAADFNAHEPTNCAAASGAYNSKGWQVWPSSPVKKSGGGALYYGYPSGKTYAFGYKHAGRVLTKAIKVPTGTKSQLSFSIYFDTSTSALYDRLKVWLVLDGKRKLFGSSGPPSNGAMWYRGGNTSTPKKWYDIVLDTSSYAGAKLQLEAYFNSANVPTAGSGMGVFIDDIKVTRECPKN